MNIRISTPALEGVYQASKWLKIQVLAEKEELSDLFHRLGSFEIYPLTGLLNESQVPMAKELFLEECGNWVDLLKRGFIPSEPQLRKVLACAWSANADAVWLQKVPGEKYLMKISEPVVQVQAHSFTYSDADGVFRPMSMGQNAIFWGIQISYPQIYQNPKTMELLKVGESPNAELFSEARRWVRDMTRPTPFVVGGLKTNVPIRLGKNCFSWISSHPQLKEQGILVHGS
ncbi:MAG: hypothetical protein JSS32_10955 [Verrucomicrobia bacterium]|nr:hypothetical protein [Verrucomicrobiota bacterium]